MRMAARSIKRPEKNEEESATLPALMVEGDCESVFLTSAWSGSPTIVDNAILTKFSQC